MAGRHREKSGEESVAINHFYGCAERFIVVIEIKVNNSDDVHSGLILSLRRTGTKPFSSTVCVASDCH